MTEPVSFSKTFQLLENAIDIAQRRHDLIAGDISNVDTPGYKAKDIDFKSAIRHAMDADSENVRLVTTHGDHMPTGSGSQPRLDVIEEAGEWNGFNYMNSDQLMTKLTENNLVYRTATETLLRKIAIMKEIIREGGR